MLRKRVDGGPIRVFLALALAFDSMHLPTLLTRICWIGCWLAVVGSGSAVWSQAVPTSEDPAKRFANDVLPLLKRRCFACHSADEPQGGLALDSPEGLKQGGHSGGQLIADSPENSELYLRVSSSSEGYRMPREQRPLSATELETIRLWIEDGGQWPETQVLRPARKETPAGFLDRMGAWWANWERQAEEGLDQTAWGSAYLILLIGVGIWLLLEVVGWVRRRFARQDSANTPRFHRWRWQILLLTALVAMLAFYRGRSIDLQQQLDSLATTAPTTEVAAFEGPISRDNLLDPPDPMHPPRLGGRYYRGNDERSERLFNGGFYRTATIDLTWVDATGQRIEWESRPTGKTYIELTLRRAPNTTSELFNRRVLSSVYLTHFCMTNSELDRSKVYLTEVEEDQVWSARLELPTLEEGADSRIDGRIYLFYGPIDQDRKPHYGICYDLTVEQGQVAKQSVLWMGSTYNLNGRVLLPTRDRVLLDRWFDFRPIPEIEGTPTTDPELLGTPEHLGNR